MELEKEPSAAISGLRDQIFKVGAGRIKPSGEGKQPVKTGAADSASWRLVELIAGDRLNDVVLVTGDKRDARSHFAGRKRQPCVVPSLWHLKKALMKLDPGESPAHEGLRSAMFDQLPSLDIWDLGIAGLEGYSTNNVHIDVHQHLTQVVTVTQISEVRDVHTIDLSRRGGRATAEADVAITLDHGYVLWDDRGGAFELDTVQELDVSAVAQVYADYDHHDRAWSVSVEHFVVES